MSLIEAINLSVHFEGASPAVSGASFEILQGITLFLGSSGSGKTTLLKVMAGLVEPTEGRLTKCRGTLGYVSQHSDLFPHMRVVDNCSRPQQVVLKRSREHSEQTARTLLECLGIADLARRFPSQLSGGQRQKVAIARALAMEARILLLDEPTASLDPRSARSLATTLLALREQGVTLVVTTHDLLFAKALGGRVYIMEKGEIIAVPEEETKVAAYFELQENHSF